VALTLEPFSHTNIERLFKIINSIDLKNLSQWHDVCELCMKVKQTCCSYNAFIEWVTWSLGLIHLNVVEPIMLTVYDSSRWFVTLTDDFTRFTWMFFMKIKDETVKHIKNFVTLMKTDCSDYSLKCLTLTLSVSILSWRTGLQSTASSENLLCPIHLKKTAFLSG
jgi:hypothetical protein